jgi:hypothetical protein
MTPEALFTAALQLEAGWKVSECRFEGEPRRLLLKLDFEQGKRFSCPQCGKLCPTHDTSTECILEARVPRSNCPEDGVLSVVVPWAREGSGFTLLFEALALLLCREMPMTAVAVALAEMSLEVAAADATWEPRGRLMNGEGRRDKARPRRGIV